MHGDILCLQRGGKASQCCSAPYTDDVICRQRFTNACLRSTASERARALMAGGLGGRIGLRRVQSGGGFSVNGAVKGSGSELWSQCMFAVYFVLLDLPDSWVWRRVAVVVVGEQGRESTGVSRSNRKETPKNAVQATL